MREKTQIDQENKKPDRYFEQTHFWATNCATETTLFFLLSIPLAKLWAPKIFKTQRIQTQKIKAIKTNP